MQSNRLYLEDRVNCRQVDDVQMSLDIGFIQYQIY